MSKITPKNENGQASKRRPKVKENQRFVTLPVVHPNAAAIDIGDRMHAVAVGPGVDPVPVREFGTFTCDLRAIVSWLKQCKVTTIAMESTGVYWKPIYAMLIQYDFDVWLVNSKQTKNVTGKKEDMSDAAWMQRLHTAAIFTRSFLPDDLTESLRTVVRQRGALIEDANRCVQRIQKNLELMNIKIHTVINDIMGKTGTAILDAIINGEREPENFLPFVDSRIKASKENILKSLEGNWRRECLFLIEQCYTQYKQLQQHMSACDKEVESILEQMQASQNEGIIEAQSQRKDSPALTQAGKGKQRKRKSKNTPVFDVRKDLHQIHGVDVLDIYGISEISALKIFSETGRDLGKWPTANCFVSWLNLCPNNKFTGGKLISSKVMKKHPNNASQAFRAAANGLQRTDNWLGDYFRKMRSKGGQKHAIVCTARKLAIIYYTMVINKVPFMPVNMDEYKEKQRKQQIATLEKKLAKLTNQAA
jgi:transposase